MLLPNQFQDNIFKPLSKPIKTEIKELNKFEIFEQNNHKPSNEVLNYSYTKASEIIKKQCYSVTFKSALEAYYYVRDIIKKPTPSLEKIISSQYYTAFNYAFYILKGPFPDGEEAIAKDAQTAYYYARDVLKKPFPAGEVVISSNPQLLILYKNLLVSFCDSNEIAIFRSCIRSIL